MWRKELGDWQERRHRRPPGGEALPASNANTGSARFMYKLPTDAPAYAPMDAPAPYVPVETRAAEDQHVTAPWVTVSGADHRDIGTIREYLDLRVGRTIAHYTVSALATQRGLTHDASDWDALQTHARHSSAFFVQFEDATAAARAVRLAHFVVESDWGVAAAAAERHRGRVHALRAASPRLSGASSGRRSARLDEAEEEEGEGNAPVYGTHSFEFNVTTCADRVFLADRAAAMQTQLWGDASLAEEADTNNNNNNNSHGLHKGPSPAPQPSAALAAARLGRAHAAGPHPTTEAASPGRRSGTLEPPHELSHTPPPPPPPLGRNYTPCPDRDDSAEDEDSNARADGHPLLPRHRAAGFSSSSSYSIDVDRRSTSTACRSDAAGTTRTSKDAHDRADHFPRLRPTADGARARGGESSFLQEEGHFTGQPLTSRAPAFAAAPQQGNRSVLSLFFTSWLSAYGNVWVALVRAVLVLLWTALRLVGVLLQWRTIKAWWRRWRRTRARQDDEAALVAAMDTLTPVPTASSTVSRPHHRGRRSSRGPRRLRHGGDAESPCALAGASPLALVSALFHRWCVLAPTPEEVDMTLWSWLSMRSPFPQQSLRDLKRYLFLHRPYYSPGQSEAFRGTPFTHYDQFRAVPRMQTAEEAMEDAYYLSRGRRPPPRALPGVEEPAVLFTWRPARVLTRYALLSALLCVLMLFKLYDHWASTAA